MPIGKNPTFNPNCDTETYNKRLARQQAKINGTWRRVKDTPTTIQADHRRNTRDEDWLKHSRVVSLERECDELNKHNTQVNDPWIIDWIRDYDLGGDYRYENLRIIRWSQQDDPKTRSDEKIRLLTKMIAAQRKLA